MSGFRPRVRRVALLSLSLALLAAACGGSGGAEGATSVVAPSAAYHARQAQFLDLCLAHAGPDRGSIYSQICTAYAGRSDYNVQAIQEIIAQIDAREGSADFNINGMLRVLYLDRRNPTLPDDLRRSMLDAISGFKYWLDEPGSDTLVWWSENHQILFHTAELLAGQLLPDVVFRNSGMTGRDHVEHALALLNRWLDTRGRFGFSEWHSNVYWNEDFGALINLAELAEDQAVTTRAAMLLDVMAFDMACNSFHGIFATAKGRTYESKFLDGLTDSTHEAMWIMLGIGEPESLEEFDADNFAATELLSSERYATPGLLEAIAADASSSFEHRQRDSITLEEGPENGIGYEAFDDVMFWWGLTGYVAPQVIARSFEMIDTYDLWNGGPPWNGLDFLKPFVGSPLLVDVAQALEPMSRGIVLESASTYTYRTPHYQLSGVQDFKPASWTGQVHVWQATLDRHAFVYTSYPGGLPGDIGGEWTGGFAPRATFHQNVGVIQYRRPVIPILDGVLFTDLSHAYFSRSGFDEIVQSGPWTCGRKGDAYVALYSQHPTEWSADNDYELIAHAKENVWIVELGDASSSGTFSDFVGAVSDARVAIGDTVAYDSPSLGTVEVGWTGPMTVGGIADDSAPYDRWRNRYAQQVFGTTRTTISFGGQTLDLDFGQPRRRLTGRAPS